MYYPSPYTREKNKQKTQGSLDNTMHLFLASARILCKVALSDQPHNELVKGALRQTQNKIFVFY